MTHQVETLIFVDPPKGKSTWRGMEAREHLSRLAGDTLPLGLFHKNSDGTADQSRALIRWGGGRKCIRITGIGFQGAQDVQMAGLQAARALMANTGRPVRVELRESAVTLQLQPIPMPFRVHKLVVAKSTPEVDTFWNRLDDESRKHRCAELVRRGIAAQIRALQRTGEDDGLPEPDEILDTMLAIHVLELGDPVVIRVAGGAKSRHVDVVDATIELRAKLGGHWNAGFMGHVGFGRIEPIDRRGTAEVFRSDLAPDDPEHPRVKRASLAGKPNP